MTRLVILWLLSEQPLHGYRIKRLLNENALRFWFPIEAGSIYAVLRSLEHGGYIETEIVEREGQRPERTRYRITRSGRELFHELLRKSWVEPARIADSFNLALAACAELEKGEGAALLAARREALQNRLQELDRVRSSAPEQSMVERMRVLTRAELSWLEEFLAKEESEDK